MLIKEIETRIFNVQRLKPTNTQGHDKCVKNTCKVVEYELNDDYCCSKADLSCELFSNYFELKLFCVILSLHGVDFHPHCVVDAHTLCSCGSFLVTITLQTAEQYQIVPGACLCQPLRYMDCGRFAGFSAAASTCVCVCVYRTE